MALLASRLFLTRTCFNYGLNWVLHLIFHSILLRKFKQEILASVSDAHFNHQTRKDGLFSILKLFKHFINLGCPLERKHKRLATWCSLKAANLLNRALQIFFSMSKFLKQGRVCSSFLFSLTICYY